MTGIHRSRPSAAVVVLRGAPGVGKSTLAGYLHREGTFQAVIEVDSIRAMLAPDAWTDREVHRRALRSAVNLATSFAENGVVTTAIVDALDRRLLNELMPMLVDCGLAFHLVALHVPEYVLRARILSRLKTAGHLETSLLLNEDATPGQQDGERCVDVSAVVEDAADALRRVVQEALAQ